jgi:hypothetical protein
LVLAVVAAAVLTTSHLSLFLPALLTRLRLVVAAAVAAAQLVETAQRLLLLTPD